MKGAFLNEAIGLFLKTLKVKIKKTVFSRAARKDGILLISKIKGRNKNVKIFKGNGYEETSTAELVYDLLNSDALLVAKLLKLSIVASSIFANFNTIGNKEIAMPIIIMKNNNLESKEIFLFEIKVKPKDIIMNKEI